MEDRYIGIKEPTDESKSTNKDKIFTRSENGFYYDVLRNRFSEEDIMPPIKKQTVNWTYNG
jgi:hypothetical protein